MSALSDENDRYLVAVLGQLRAELARQKAGREIEQTMLRNALPQLAALERVRALHVIEEAVTARPWCASDKMLWPCPTTRALKEPTP